MGDYKTSNIAKFRWKLWWSHLVTTLLRMFRLRGRPRVLGVRVGADLPLLPHGRRHAALLPLRLLQGGARLRSSYC